MSESSCVGIIRRSSDGENNGICYLRKSVDIERCDSGTEWELHVNGREGGRVIHLYLQCNFDIIYQMVQLLRKNHHRAMTTTNIVLLGLKMENAQEVLTT